MKPVIASAALAACVGALTLIPPIPTARACGGCFSPPETITSVDSHRMVISLSPTRTILWDQIRYTGNPADFVWVLPVPSADAAIDVADSLFFDELEARTAVQVSPPFLAPPNCPPPPPGVGGAQDAGASADNDAGGVDVYREEVVGPYETVVIGSEDATALVTWLNDHGYRVPAQTLPTIQYYTDLESKFIVLRLAPSQGISAMQPVRVEYPGYMSTFPLKMVTVGTSGTVALTLWVFAEQRYEPKNYPSLELSPSQLVWDFSTSASNYRQLFRDAIDDAGGRGWVTQMATPASSLWISSPEIGVATSVIPFPFVTRLETDVLVDHLSEDLQLGPSSGGYVDNFLQATQALNPPPPPSCPDWDGDGEPDRWHDGGGGVIYGCSHGSSAAGGVALVAFAVLLVVRRRRHRVA